MRKKLLVLLAVSSLCFALPVTEITSTPPKSLDPKAVNDLISILKQGYDHPKISLNPDETIKSMLAREAGELNPAVVQKVMATIQCSREYHIDYNPILTIIDYSLPSNQKRLWVFDLNQKKLLFHTYVSHGIKSGALLTNYFSNKHDSKASSLGVYKTQQAYAGREGTSLRLDGLDRGFNDNASSRAIVMHGGWYVNSKFIKKYGRPGRSWGCPALPSSLAKSIIDTIKDNSLFVVYYPSEDWYAKSKFLNCHRFSPKNPAQPENTLPIVEAADTREPILFADVNQNNKREENEPILVVSTEVYEQLFHKKSPLERMLRRQINHKEYIALTDSELKALLHTYEVTQLNSQSQLKDVYFVVPEVVMRRGYYATQMKMLNWGQIKDIKSTSGSAELGVGDVSALAAVYAVYFDHKSPVTLKPTERFIRWLGL